MELCNIIERCQQGDREAFGLLYTASRDQLRTLCLRYVPNENVADDLLHDAFVVIITHIAQLNDPTKAMTWMQQIMRNTALLYLRNQASGYSHLLHLKGKRITDPTDTTPMSGRLFLFIPINNVEELFATPPAKSNPKRF